MNFFYSPISRFRNSINQNRVFEVTFYDSKGFSIEKQKVMGGRRAQIIELEYSTRSTIVTIFDSSKLPELSMQ